MKKLFPIALLLSALTAVAQLNEQPKLSGTLFTPATSNAPNVYQGTFLDPSGQPISSAGTSTNSRPVINVRTYGAIADVGVTDSTRAVSNAAVAALAQRLPLYFPGGPAGTYYKMSAPLVFDYNAWLGGVNIPFFDTSDGVEIIADLNACIVATGDNSLLVFTNGLNWAKITGGKWLHNGAATSTKPGIAFYTVLADGNNSDDVILSGLQIQGFKYGLYSESSSSMTVQSCAFQGNQWPFWLVDTNQAGITATPNNSVSFLSDAFTGNWNGGFLRGGNGVIFDNTEAGGPTQTNFLTISASGLNLILRGGNIELYEGAAVNIIDGGGNASSVNIHEDNLGLKDFSGHVWNIWNTNVNGSPRVYIDSATVGAGAIRSWDCATLHLWSVGQGSTPIQGSNQFTGAFTNRLGMNREVMAADGVNYSGQAPDNTWEGSWYQRYAFDAKGRTMIGVGAISNWGPNQITYHIPILQYNYDLADGKIPSSGANNWSVQQTFSTSNYWITPQRFAASPTLPMEIKQVSLSAGTANILKLRGGFNAVSSGLSIGASLYNDTQNGGSIAFAFDSAFSPGGNGDLIVLRPNGDAVNGTETNAAYAKWDGSFHAANGLVADGGGFVQPTNYVAANFAIVDGSVKLVPSNNWMYAVTRRSTNAVFQIQP